MSCASFGSSSDVALFYAVDPDPTADMPTTTAWKPVPYTAESLTSGLSSSVSEQINDTRSYSTSKLVSGEVAGSISFEVYFGSFVENMLISVLQDDTSALHVTEGTRSWDDTDVIRNGSTKKCFAFLKRVRRSTGTYDMFLFRGCQISSLSLNMDSGSVVTGDVSLMGTGVGDPGSSVSVYKNIAGTAAPLDTAGIGNGTPSGDGWTFEGYPTTNLMSSAENFANFIIRDSGAADTGLVAQSVSVSIDNQMRTQMAVGEGTLYAKGIGSSRFMTTMSISAYYADPTIYEALLADENLSCTFDLKDDNTTGYSFSFPKIQVQSGGMPQAGSADSDLLLSTEFQAFEDPTNGTIRVTLDATSA